MCCQLSDLQRKNIESAHMCFVDNIQNAAQHQESVDTQLRQHALDIKENHTVTVGDWVKGFYYLTIARWTNPLKYKLAWKLVGWLNE